MRLALQRDLPLRELLGDIDGGKQMRATQLLHNLGQSIWLDNITRDLLGSGMLKTYIDGLSVTGLISNPTIFNHAIKNSSAYSAAIRKKFAQNKSGETVFLELALEDLTRAADLFRPTYDRTNGSVTTARVRHRQNLGRRQRTACSCRPRELNHKLGTAIAMRTYKAARDVLSSPRWHRIYNAGAYLHRLLWASTGTKDPTASDVLYVKALAAPFTVNTMPESTLKALANSKEVDRFWPMGELRGSVIEVRRSWHQHRLTGCSASR